MPILAESWNASVRNIAYATAYPLTTQSFWLSNFDHTSQADNARESVKTREADFLLLSDKNICVGLPFQLKIFTLKNTYYLLHPAKQNFNCKDTCLLFISNYLEIHILWSLHWLYSIGLRVITEIDSSLSNDCHGRQKDLFQGVIISRFSPTFSYGGKSG